MKYLLSFTLVLFTILNTSAQRTVDFKAEFQTTKFKEVNVNGISLGLVHKSDWLLQYDFETQTQTPFNLPSGYKGVDLKESYFINSLSIGKSIPLFEKESLRLVTKLGIHTGSYKGYDQFAALPEQDDITVLEALDSGLGAILLLPIALTDHLDDQSHSFEEVNEKLNGINGEILLEYQFQSRIVISVGGKWIKNKRITDFGRTIKFGFQF